MITGTVMKPQQQRRTSRMFAIVRRRVALLGTVFVATFAVGVAVYVMTPKFYETNVRLIAGNANASSPKIAASDDSSLPLLDVMLQLRGEQTADTLAQLIRESSVADRVIADLGLHVGARTLLERVEAAPVVNTTILEVKVNWTDPNVSAAIANAYARAFVEQERAFVAAGAANIVTFLEAEIPGARKRMHTTRAALDAFSVKSGIVDVTHQTQARIDAATDIRERIAHLRIDIEESVAESGALAFAVNSAPHDVVDGQDRAPDPIMSSLRARSAELGVELGTDMRRYTADYPQVRALIAEKQQVDRAIASRPRTIVSATHVVPNPLVASVAQQQATLHAKMEGDRAQISELERQAAGLDSTVRSLPAQTSHYAELSRDAKLAEDVYTALQHKLADALILKTTAYSDLAITQPARADFATKLPNFKVSMVLSLLAALLAAGAAVALAERLGGRFSNELDVERELMLPTLASVPQLPRDNATGGAIRSALIESFFAMVMAIRYSSDEPVRTIAITSPSAGDGKSSVALNLALTLAEIEPRVLLIDGDMRMPSLDRKLNLENDVGLSDVLVGRALIEHAIQRTVHPGLDLLTAGKKPPNPLALLQSPRFMKLLDGLRATYRIIVVDAPALESVLDPAMISAACDGTVLIVARNRTRHREARAALAKLRSSGARKVLGAVVNRRELRLRPSAYQNELSSPVYLGGEGVTMIPGHQ